MKKTIFLPCFLMLGLMVNAQAVLKPNSKYKSLSDYLSQSLVNSKIADSCFSGFFYLKFSLNKKGAISDYSCSDDFPSIAKTDMKRYLDSAVNLLNNEFVQKVWKGKRTIIIPVLITLDYHCIIKGNRYLDRPSSDPAKEQEDLYHAGLIMSVHDEIGLKTTIERSLTFAGVLTSQGIDCILFEPCVFTSRWPKRSIE